MCAGHPRAILLGSAHVWRIVFIFAATLVVANTMGLLPENDDIECADQRDGKQCPPTCPTCVCAWHSLRSAPTASVELPAFELMTAAAEPPPPSGANGRAAPAPTTRPPIG